MRSPVITSYARASQNPLLIMRAKVFCVLLSAVSSTVLSVSFSVPPKLTALFHDHLFGTFLLLT